MNVKWHGRHVLPKRASLEQRSEWHREHQQPCGCRPIPAMLLEQMSLREQISLREQMQASAGQRVPSSGSASDPPPASAEPHGSIAETKFSNIVLAFGDQPSVSYGGKGFGSSAL